jgi:hypothetical protein
MAAADLTVDLPNGIWTLLGTGNATQATIIHAGGRDVLVRAVAGANPPSAIITDGLIIASGGDGHRSGFLKTDLTALTFDAAPTHVYARPSGVGTAKVYYADDAA